MTEEILGKLKLMKEWIINTNLKWVYVQASILGMISSYRSIVVYENGRISEQEWNNKSKLIRIRNIHLNGSFEHMYIDKENSKSFWTWIIHEADGTIRKGNTFDNKWNGYHEIIFPNGDKKIWNVLKEWIFGDVKYISAKDGSIKITKYSN